MATQAEVIDRALVRVGVLPYDQSSTSEQTGQVTPVLTAFHAEGVDLGFIRWELSDIPDEVSDALVSVTAFLIADTFGASTERYARLEKAYDRDLRKIHAYGALEYSGTTEVEEY